MLNKYLLRIATPMYLQASPNLIVPDVTVYVSATSREKAKAIGDLATAPANHQTFS